MILTSEEIMEIIALEIESVEKQYAHKVQDTKNHLGFDYYADTKCMEDVRDLGRYLYDLRYVQNLIKVKECQRGREC